MTSGTVILAHHSAAVRDGIAAVMQERNRGIRVEQTDSGNDVVLMQAAMRADVILVDMEMPGIPGERLMTELKQDIVNPRLLVCSRDDSSQAEKKALRLGANAYAAEPISPERVAGLLQEQIALRSTQGEMEGGFMAERALQRLFVEHGIPCSMQGYVYLKQAIRLILAGEEEPGSIGRLYERISLRYGCDSRAIERSIRYAIRRCWQKAGRPDEECPTNKEFLNVLLGDGMLEESGLFRPCVSVFGQRRRIFR